MSPDVFLPALIPVDIVGCPARRSAAGAAVSTGITAAQLLALPPPLAPWPELTPELAQGLVDAGVATQWATQVLDQAVAAWILDVAWLKGGDRVCVLRECLPGQAQTSPHWLGVGIVHDLSLSQAQIRALTPALGQMVAEFFQASGLSLADVPNAGAPQPPGHSHSYRHEWEQRRTQPPAAGLAAFLEQRRLTTTLEPSDPSAARLRL